MPKLKKAKKTANSLHVLILGLFHLCLSWTTGPVPAKGVPGLGDSDPARLWVLVEGKSGSGIWTSFSGCRAAGSRSAGCISITALLDAMVAVCIAEGEGRLEYVNDMPTSPPPIPPSHSCLRTRHI